MTDKEHVKALKKKLIELREKIKLELAILDDKDQGINKPKMKNEL